MATERVKWVKHDPTRLYAEAYGTRIWIDRDGPKTWDVRVDVAWLGTWRAVKGSERAAKRAGLELARAALARGNERSNQRLYRRMYGKTKS